MANPALVSQDAVEFAALQNPTALVSQVTAEFAVLQNPVALVSQVVFEMAILPGTPPPDRTINKLSGGRPKSLPKNDWDHCLDGVRECFRLVCKRVCPKPRPMISWPWDQEEGVPPDAVPFRQTGGIVTPLTAAGDVAIFSFRVPVGYDGIILQGYNLYQGTGFVQGSGDILWRLRINNSYYVKDWGSVAFSLGGVSDPYPFSDALFITSGQTVTMLVNVPNTSGTIQVGASRILGALMGYFLPR